MAGQALIDQGVDRRKAIFKFCKDFIKENGYGPSVAEITSAVGLASKTAVRYHLALMLEQGVITMQPGVYRSIRIPDGRRQPV